MKRELIIDHVLVWAVAYVQQQLENFRTARLLRSLPGLLRPIYFGLEWM